MKKIFHACIIACAVLSTNSFAEQSYACKVMLERSSEMFCQKDSENIASAPVKLEVEATVAKKEGSFACSTMLERGSEMFCAEDGGIPGAIIVSE